MLLFNSIFALLPLVVLVSAAPKRPWTGIGPLRRIRFQCTCAILAKDHYLGDEYSLEQTTTACSRVATAHECFLSAAMYDDSCAVWYTHGVPEDPEEENNIEKYHIDASWCDDEEGLCQMELLKAAQDVRDAEGSGSL